MCMFYHFYQENLGGFFEGNYVDLFIETESKEQAISFVKDKDLLKGDPDRWSYYQVNMEEIKESWPTIKTVEDFAKYCGAQTTKLKSRVYYLDGRIMTYGK